MSAYAAVRLIAAREIKVKLRDRTFLISTAFFLFIAVAATVLPGLLGGGSSTVAVADRGVAARLAHAPGVVVKAVADDVTAVAQVKSGDADAAVVAGPAVVAMKEAPSALLGALSTTPPVRLLSPDTRDPFLKFVVPFALAFVFFITSFTFGLQIAMSVAEEKQTRVVEILVASVPVRALLAGKVAAMTVLAFGQIALIALVTVLGVRVAEVDPVVLPPIWWFLPFFVLGFLMLATLWAGVGGLAGRQEDVGGLSMPLNLAVMLPFFAVVFLSDNVPVMRVLSYVPFSAAVAMPVRLFTGDAAGWEPVVSLVLLAATTAGLLLVGARLYEGSLLRTNGRTSYATAWSLARD
jgi:ABC-2 type transport system permease protein